MGAPDLLAQLSALGVRLRREGQSLVAKPRSALTDTARAMIRKHKAELLAVLDPAAENRRQRALAKLAADPTLRLAVICDGEGDPVPVAVAIRGKGTCEVLIPAAKFDPFLLLDLIKRHGDTVH